MPDVIRVYGIDMSSFDAKEYLASLHHSNSCTREDKDQYNAGDITVGYVKFDDLGGHSLNFLIYSCAKCGGNYAIVGELPSKLMRRL